MSVVRCFRFAVSLVMTLSFTLACVAVSRAADPVEINVIVPMTAVLLSLEKDIRQHSLPSKGTSISTAAFADGP